MDKQYRENVAQVWKDTEKKVDPDWANSIYEKMGLAPELCPACNAHLKWTGDELICLNACHLGIGDGRRFSTEHLIKTVLQP